MSRLLTTAPSWHYVGVLIACVVVTIPLELVFGARVYRHPRRLALTLLLVSVPFLAIDLFAVDAGLWWFSPDHTLGVVLPGGLPIEEVLFFLVIPICALLTYGAVASPRWRRLGKRA